MYKIMIVEDEPPILRDIKKKISMSSDYFKVAATAFTAEEAYKQLTDIKPDLIITDIRMPGKGGLWLLRQARELYPEIYCMILSGYKDFEYLRESLKLKVEDYLLKPISMKDLKEQLDVIKLKLMERDKELIANQFRNLLKKNNNMVLNEAVKKYDCFRSLIIYKGSLDLRVNKTTVRQYDLSKYINDVKDFLDKLIEGDCWIIQEYSFNGFYIILGENNLGIKNDIFYKKLAQELLPICEDHEITTIVVSNVITSLSIFEEEINNMVKVLNKYLVLGKSKVITRWDKAIDFAEFVPKGDKFIEKFILNLIKKDRNGLKREIKEFLKFCRENGVPQTWIQRTIKEIFKSREIPGYSFNCFKDMEIENDIDTIFFESSDFNDLLAEIWDLCTEIFYSGAGQSEEYTNYDIVEKIKKYLDSNFAKQITLNMLSELFGYTPPYLSRIFKKFNGISPIEYLIAKRVESAQDIIRKYPDIKIKDVSGRVGYEDIYYFSKLFKTLTGKTFSEYKNSIRSENNTDSDENR